MLIQTLLTERAEIRSSIESSARYAGVALSVLIGALAHFDEGAWQRVPHNQRIQHIVILLLLVIILVGGFGIYVGYLRERLKRNLTQLNARLSALGEAAQEEHVTSFAACLSYVSTAVLVLILVYGFFLR